MGMTATDELRRLLDERGVEWSKGAFPNEARTYWQDIVARPWNEQRLYVSALLTPEQAIAATLGNDGVERSSDGVAERGTYHITERNGDWYCDACGNEVGASDPTSELFIDGNAIELWEFCPRCGREVAK